MRLRGLFRTVCMRLITVSRLLLENQQAHTGMANSGVVDLNSDLSRLWWLDLNLLNRKVLASFPGDGSLFQLALYPRIHRPSYALPRISSLVDFRFRRDM
jgi:hypothetical protein